MKNGLIPGAMAVFLCAGGAMAGQTPDTPTTSPSTVAAPPSDPARPSAERPAYANSTPDPEDVRYKYDRDENAISGITFLAGGGVEGYTGSLAPRIGPGASWGVTVGLRPLKVLGLELGYTGAANDLRNSNLYPGGKGPDIVRHGGQAVLTLGLPTAVQPYILGGVGLSHYSVRSGIQAAGFHDDTSGLIPLGAGVRAHIFHFTVDARFVYNVLFSQGFTDRANPQSIVGIKSIDAGSWRTLLQIGSTF
jgi:hypothetical protein